MRSPVLKQGESAKRIGIHGRPRSGSTRGHWQNVHREAITGRWSDVRTTANRYQSYAFAYSPASRWKRSPQLRPEGRSTEVSEGARRQCDAGRRARRRLILARLTRRLSMETVNRLAAKVKKSSPIHDSSPALVRNGNLKVDAIEAAASKAPRVDMPIRTTLLFKLASLFIILGVP